MQCGPLPTSWRLTKALLTSLTIPTRWPSHRALWLSANNERSKRVHSSSLPQASSSGSTSSSWHSWRKTFTLCRLQACCDTQSKTITSSCMAATQPSQSRYGCHYTSTFAIKCWAERGNRFKRTGSGNWRTSQMIQILSSMMGLIITTTKLLLRKMGERLTRLKERRNRIAKTKTVRKQIE